jgi:hypothetical protein
VEAVQDVGKQDFALQSLSGSRAYYRLQRAKPGAINLAGRGLFLYYVNSIVMLLAETAVTNKTELLSKRADMISEMYFHMNNFSEKLYELFSHV